MMFNIILEKRHETFLNESICFIGVLLQNNKINYITENQTYRLPFLKIKEGYITTPEIYNEVRRIENVSVYKNNIKILQKKTHENSKEKIINHNSWIFDLYDSKDLRKIKALISQWEKDKKIYMANTEVLPNIDGKVNVLAGVSSGNGLAELAHIKKPKKVIFFDYNKKSLQFQEKLIQSKDRKKVYYKYIKNLTLGRPIHVGEREIECLDWTKIDSLYENLKKTEVCFLKKDFRKSADLIQFFTEIDYNTHVWLSNIFHYSTNLFSFNLKSYDLVDYWKKKKNLKICPYTRIKYEDSHNS